MSSPAFVNLHLHTEYSLVDSTVRIPALMQQCVSSGMPAVALTDQNNLFGLVKFYRKAMAAGIKPIIGVDLKILNEDEQERPYTLLLLCQDNIGYRNLRVIPNGIALTITNPEQLSEARQRLRALGQGMSLDTDNQNIRLTFTQELLRDRKNAAIAQAMEVVRRRIDAANPANSVG